MATAGAWVAAGWLRKTARVASAAYSLSNCQITDERSVLPGGTGFAFAAVDLPSLCAWCNPFIRCWLSVLCCHAADDVLPAAEARGLLDEDDELARFDPLWQAHIQGLQSHAPNAGQNMAVGPCQVGGGNRQGVRN